MRIFTYDFRCYTRGTIVRKSVTVEAVSQPAGLPIARRILAATSGRVIERTAELVDWNIVTASQPVTMNLDSTHYGLHSRH